MSHGLSPDARPRRAGTQERLAVRLHAAGVRVPDGADELLAWGRATHAQRAFYRELAAAARRFLAEDAERERRETDARLLERARDPRPPPPPPTPTLVTHEGAGWTATSPHPGTPEAYAACPVCRKNP